MPTLERWPFPQDHIPRSYAAASKLTIAAVGIFSKICAGQCIVMIISFGFETE